MRFRIAIQPQRVAVCRLAPADPLPAWIRGAFTSVTRTVDELSIVCDEAAVPETIQADRGWRVLQVAGPFAFEVTGVAAALTTALANAGVSVLLIATYDTDYLLVRDDVLHRAAEALRTAGHDIS